MRRVPGALSGTTVVLAPPEGAVAGVDVRGAAPGTRETDLLDPRNTVQRVHAVVLSGGSAFGLAAADGVMARLAAAGVGFAVPGAVVPIVPAAVLFDLGRGGPAATPRCARPPRPGRPPSTPRRTGRSRRASSAPARAPWSAASRAGSGRRARSSTTGRPWPRWRR